MAVHHFLAAFTLAVIAYLLKVNPPTNYLSYAEMFESFCGLAIPRPPPRYQALGIRSIPILFFATTSYLAVEYSM
jgi:hypothetical protein